MAQITNGIRSMLSSPFVYDTLQNIMGAGRVRRELINEFLRAHGKCRILDLGCGTAEILKYLPNTVEYWGYDISQEYIAAAKAEHGTRGNFHCGVLRQPDLDSLPKFDRVLATGLLHHLDDDEASHFFAMAKEALKPSGHVVTCDPCIAQGQNPLARFLILSDRGQNVRSSAGYISLTKGFFNNVNGSLRHRACIPYTHWIMECSN